MNVALKTNTDGQLLKTGSGNILRENYIFGKCFRSDKTAYLATKDNLGINNIPLHIMSHVGSNSAFTGYTCYAVVIDGASHMYSTIQANGASSAYSVWPTNASVLNCFSGGSNAALAGRQFFNQQFVDNSGIGNVIQGLNGVYAANNWNFPNTGIAGFEFGRVLQGQSWSYAQSTLAIYNRICSEQEKTSFYNNLSGNEVLSTIGLRGYYKFQQAEILDFSTALDGSDMRVGVRDFSPIGTNHLYFIGLPAGTNAAKLDYANANLFVNYI